MQNSFSNSVSILVVLILRLLLTEVHSNSSVLQDGLPAHRKLLITCRASGLLLSLASPLRPLWYKRPC